MSCLSAKSLAELEAGCIEGDERAAAAAHVASCAECATRIEGLRKLLGAFAAKEPAPEIAPRPDTWSQIAARLRADESRLAVAIACGYCKGRLARADAVYCAACLAPEHVECWDEHGACAACGATERVRAQATTPRPRPAPRRGGLLLVLGAVAAASGVAAFALHEPPSRGTVTPRPVDLAAGTTPSGTAPVVSRVESAYEVELRLGRAAVAAGALDEATAHFTKAVGLQPSYPEAYAGRGAVALRQERVAAAIKDFEAAITRRAECWDAHLGLGHALELALDDERAAEQYEEVLKSGAAPREARIEALVARARLYALRSDRVEVLSELDLNDRTEKSRDGATPARMALGELLVEGGAERVKRAEKARALYDAALALAPSDFEALAGRIRLGLATGALDEVTPLVRRLGEAAAKLSLRERVATEDLIGRFLLARKEPLEAIGRFERALSLDAKDPVAVAGLASAYLLRDGPDSAEARSLFQRAHALRSQGSDRELAFFDRECEKYVASAVRSKKVECYAYVRRAFARIIERNPFDALAYVQRGRSAAAWEDWDFALRDANAAIALDPSLAEAFVFQGFLLGRDLPRERDPKTQRPLRLRDEKAARADFDRAVELALDDRVKGEALYGRALVASRSAARGTSAMEAIRADLDRAIASLPPDVLDRLDDLTIPAEVVKDAVEYHELAADLSEFAQRGEDLVKAVVAASKRAHDAGEVLKGQRKYSEAIDCFDRATLLDPLLADAFLARGACHLKLGNMMTGILDFARALELDPRYSERFYNQTYQVSYVVDLNRVIAELNKIVAEHPNLSYVVFLRGFFYVAKTEFKKLDPKDVALGIADFDRTLQLNPRHVSAWIYRGFLRMRAHDFGPALHDYDAALALDAESGLVHFLKAALYAQTGEREEAIEELRVSIAEKHFKGFERVKNDRAFAAIRDDPRVQKLIQK